MRRTSGCFPTPATKENESEKLPIKGSQLTATSLGPIAKCGPPIMIHDNSYRTQRLRRPMAYQGRRPRHGQSSLAAQSRFFPRMFDNQVTRMQPPYAYMLHIFKHRIRLPACRLCMSDRRRNAEELAAATKNEELQMQLTITFKSRYMNSWSTPITPHPRVCIGRTHRAFSRLLQGTDNPTHTTLPPPMPRFTAARRGRDARPPPPPPACIYARIVRAVLSGHLSSPGEVLSEGSGVARYVQQ
jgi:hypothetical protein